MNQNDPGVSRGSLPKIFSRKRKGLRKRKPELSFERFIPVDNLTINQGKEVFPF